MSNRGKFPGRLRNAQLIRSPSVVQVLDIVIPRICEIEMLHLLARKSAPVTLMIPRGQKPKATNLKLVMNNPGNRPLPGIRAQSREMKTV